MNASTVVREHRFVLGKLRGLADRDLVGLLAALDGLSVAATRNALIEVVPGLLAPYEAAASELAAVTYEDLRAASSARGTFYAETAPMAFTGTRAEATARWAVGAIVDEGLDATLFSRLAGSSARAIFDASRSTMQMNTLRDKVKVGYQRMARPGCCAFCGMLASRGAVYGTQSSGGGRVRYERDGKSWTGTETHDDCHCVVMPVFAGSEMEYLAKADQSKFEALYVKASRASDGSDTKSILAAWRQENGSH